MKTVKGINAALLFLAIGIPITLIMISYGVPKTTEIQLVEINGTEIPAEKQLVFINITNYKETVYVMPCNQTDDSRISAYTIHGCMGKGCWYENSSGGKYSPGYDQ